MNNNKKQASIANYSIQIKTLTPVSIGTDQAQVLSPYSDFILNRNKIIYLDQKVIEKRLQEVPQLIDEYVGLIYEGMNDSETQSNANLQNFIEGKLKLDMAEVGTLQLANKGIRLGRKTQIVPTIKTAGLPYIPGSSVKGAIRTALLYWWLMETEAGEKMMDNWASQIEACYKACKGFMEEYVDLLKKQNTLKRKRQRLDSNDFQKLKRHQRSLKDNLKEHIHIKDDDVLFGDIRERGRTQPLDAHLIRIGDTETLSREQMAVYYTQRLHLGSGKLTVPQVKEAILPNQTADCSWRIWQQIEQAELQFLNTGTAKDLLEKINVFSRDAIDFEMEEIERLMKNADKEKERSLNALHRAYDDLRRQIDEGRYLMRLGAGKSYFNNSFGLALAYYDEDLTLFNQFRRLYDLEPAQKTFPITRTVTTLGKKVEQPMGWVEVMVDNG